MSAKLKYAMCGLGLVLLLSGGQALAQFVNEDIPDEMIQGEGLIDPDGGGDPENLPWGWYEGLKPLDHPPDAETLYYREVLPTGVRFKVSTTISTDDEWWDIAIQDDWPVANDPLAYPDGYGFPVTDGYGGAWATWTGYTAYQLAITNNSTIDWVKVNGFYKPNWGPPAEEPDPQNHANYHKTSEEWAAPGETVVVTGYFGPPGLVNVVCFGFMLGAYYGSTGDQHATEFDVTVTARGIPKPSDVYIDDDWTGSEPGEPVGAGYVYGYNAFSTIQDGIAGVEGSTVNVANGTYAGPVTIDKGITITGESEAGVVVANAGTGNVFDIDASGFDVTLENMTISNGDHGVYSAAGNVDVHGCTFTGNVVDLYVLADAATSLANNNSFSGSTYGVQNVDTGGQLDASCCWWGGLSGPASDLNHVVGVAVEGNVAYIPWLDGPGGACDQYPSTVDVSSASAPINVDTDCVTVDVNLNREGSSTAGFISVEFTLSPELELCTGSPGADILMAGGEGSWLGDLDAVFLIDALSAPTYTVDIAVEGGSNCGPAAGGKLFTINLGTTLEAENDGAGIVIVDDVRFRHCDVSPLACEPGLAGSVTIDLTPPPALTVLGAAQNKSNNDADGTTVIDLSWADPGSGATGVEIWRKGYADYPEYDSSPTFGPLIDGSWTLVTDPEPEPVGSLAYADEPLTRNFWYYAAYVIDNNGNYSEAATITTHGTLNYHLGDVAGGASAGDGNNLVSTADISALGSSYGVSLIPGDPVNYLDVGPTTNYSVDALPTTDDQVEFEDMIMFAINYGEVGKSLTRPTPSAFNEITLQMGETGTVGGSFPVEIWMAGDGRIQALSLPLTWDDSVVEPVAMQPGDFLDQHGGPHLVLSAEPGTVDAALFGVGERGICGEGLLAIVTFQVKAPGLPQISVGEIKARDAENQAVALKPAVAEQLPLMLPSQTVLNTAVPNPFNPSTKVSFVLAQAGHVKLEIYTVGGRRVRTLLNTDLAAGPHELEWDGTDGTGQAVSSGTYLMRLIAPDHTQSRPLTLLK